MERRVIKTVEEAEQFFHDFSWELYALDTETTSLNWSEQQVIGISVCDGNKTGYFTKPELFIERMGDPDCHKVLIMHNATFDIKAMYKAGAYYGYVEIFDTMVAAHLLDEEGPKSLKDLAKLHLGKDVVKYDEAIKHGTNSKEFYEYAMNDAEWTYELAMLFRPMLEEQGLTKLFREIEMPFLQVLATMEMNGVMVDQEKITRVTKELQEKALHSEAQLYQILGVKYEMQYDLEGKMTVKGKYNFNSPVQIKEVLKSVGVVVETTDKKELSKYRDVPFVAEFIRYKGIQKLLSAFFLPLPSVIDSDGRVRPHFNDTGTVTGRLSCSNPNLQQLPKDDKSIGVSTRSCFIAPPGKKLVAVDYSQQELRIMTELSQDPALIKIIKNGGDLHLINANLVFNLGIPEEKLYENHPEYESIKKEYKKDRDKGKVFSFGIPYGMGPHKLSRDFNVSVTEAEQLLKTFFSGFPALERSIRDCHNQAERELFVTTNTGRRRRFRKNDWGKIDGSSLRQSFNFLIQSYGADLIRLACIRLQMYADMHPYMGIKLIMTVHDEIVFEVNDDWADYAMTLSEKILEGCDSKMCVPLKAEASSGNDYSEAK
jgi:DNA polymerase I